MPTYTYRCESCEHQFDIVQRMSEDSLTECPDCTAPALVKQIQAVGFALKGTGWYVTDFRDKGKQVKKSDDEAAKTEASEAKTETKAGDTESKTETKTETKPEPKADPKSAAAPSP